MHSSPVCWGLAELKVGVFVGTLRGPHQTHQHREHKKKKTAPEIDIDGDQSKAHKQNTTLLLFYNFINSFLWSSLFCFWITLIPKIGRSAEYTLINYGPTKQKDTECKPSKVLPNKACHK